MSRGTPQSISMSWILWHFTVLKWNEVAISLRWRQFMDITHGLGQRQQRRLVDFLSIVNDLFQWCENNSARLCACFTWEIHRCEAVYKSIRGITVAFTLNLAMVVLCFPHTKSLVGALGAEWPISGSVFPLNCVFCLPECSRRQTGMGHWKEPDTDRQQSLTAKQTSCEEGVKNRQ